MSEVVRRQMTKGPVKIYFKWDCDNKTFQINDENNDSVYIYST